MTDIAPGWYKDPAEPTTQRYWDGEGWLGAPLPAEATPPDSPPPLEVAPPPPAPVLPTELPRPAPTTVPVGGAPPSGHGSPGVLGRGGPMPPAPPPGWPTGYPYPIPGVVRVPEPRPHGFRLAHAGARFAARMVDILAVFALAAAANGWIAHEFWVRWQPWFRASEEAQRTGATAPDGSQLTLLIFAMLLVATMVWFAYEVPSTGNSGQTLGKKILGIKVVRLESGEQLGLGRSFRRWSRLGVPTLLWPCFGAGLLLQLVDCFFVITDRPLHQALHDKGAATVVVEVPRSRPADPAPLENATSGGQNAHPR